MPGDDLVLNVRQIAGYSSLGVEAADQLLLQRGGLGGPYLSGRADELVAYALLYNTLPLQLGIEAPSNTDGGQVYAYALNTPNGGQWMWNGYLPLLGGPISRLNAGALGKISFDGGPIGWQFSTAPPGPAQTPVAIGTFVEALNISPAGYLTVGVQVLLGRDPTSPLEAATARWVGANTANSFNGRTGPVRLWIDDILCAGGAPIFSPVFQGSPRAVTPPPWSNSSRLATTAFVAAAVAAGVDVTGFAPLDSPNFTGNPTAPTAAQGSSDGQIASTAFVMNAVADSTAGVVSFNGRTGLVALMASDLTGVGGALLASPIFTGSPQGPTAAPGTSDAQFATTAFVQAAIAAIGSGVVSFNGRAGAITLTSADVAAVGVTSFNGRQGTVTLLGNDVSAAGGALLASPSFTGIPAAPTAAPGTSSVQVATTAFVMAALAAGGGVLSFNGRAGAITLTSADISAAGGALLASVVSSFNTRQGAVTLAAGDITGAGGALSAGVTNGSNAAAGQVGEIAFASVASTGQIVVTSATSANITSISLTAGDWDVTGLVYIVAGGGVASAGVTIGQCWGWVNTISAALPATAGAGLWIGYGGAANINVGHATGRVRLNLTATTIVYLGFLAQFTGGNNQVGGWGSIYARRVR
jgi:hypothetical protein